MKINFFIIGTSTLMLCAQSAPAAISGGATCEDCTLNGKCSTYGIACCSPCQIRPVDPTPATCTESNCKSDTDWTSHSTGYQKRTIRSCNATNTLCQQTTEYQCAAGYYGSSTNGSTGCTKCPSSGGVAGQSAAGSIAITSCYIPSGNTFSDSTGSGTYTGNCYYSN